ncbi:NUDIX hydrolase [Streptomyces sp. NPDC059092]|uniref:NUDIX hydrolase n=1 Tax=Streptomyces sp. NPDC059092 TaxID=3346725 RepID=UPI0036C7559C
MSNGQWYPPEWPEQIRALAAGEITAVTPRRAATVMLLRDEPGGPAVHMLRRRTSMAFAAGAYAYPGGGVDPRDDDRLVGWAGPGRDVWARRLGVGPAAAQAIVCAAVRETYEEAGVLLAGETADTVVGDLGGYDRTGGDDRGAGGAGGARGVDGVHGARDDDRDGWEADRAALVARELSFADFLHRRGLILRSDLLGAWARWITPEFEPRRYDTWFFVATLPPGQRTRNASTEADRTVWIRPSEATEAYDRGELLMMPPTVATLRQLQPYGTAADALAGAEGRDLAPVLATARLEGEELVLSWPGHDEFTKRVDPAPPHDLSGDPSGPIPGPGPSSGLGAGSGSGEQSPAGGTR